VYGPPRVYTEAVAVEAAAGEDARLEVSLCGEPRPEVKWDLGLVVLSPGSRHGRFVTDILVGVPGSLHCYKTVLYIVGAVQGYPQQRAKSCYLYIIREALQTLNVCCKFLWNAGQLFPAFPCT
jgi:hypothetical protein